MKRKIDQTELLQLLLNGSTEDISDIVDTVHPADILDILHAEPERTAEILKHLPNDFIADIVEEEDDEDKYELIKKFSEPKQKHILKEMDNDEITDLIGELDEAEGAEVLGKMNKEDQENVRRLMEYDPETAAGIMSTEFIAIHSHNTVMDTLKFLQSHTDDDTDYYLYVTDPQGYLKGVISLRHIVSSTFDTPIMDIINPNVITVHQDDDQEAVAHQFEKYGFIMMPVVDDENRMIGVISFDDIMEIIQEENTEDIHHLGGLNKEERVDSTFKESVNSRLPWLVVNLGTAILAAFVVSQFESTISKVVTLAAIMPIITGMGGNAGTQSMTLIVRGISLEELTGENAWSVFRKEVSVGMVDGLVVGIIMGLLAFIFEGNFVFAAIAGIAMFLNMLMANTAGFVIPVILKKLHVDPALASTVFVTTVTDVLGFFFFLGLATVVLPYIA